MPDRDVIFLVNEGAVDETCHSGMNSEPIPLPTWAQVTERQPRTLVNVGSRVPWTLGAAAATAVAYVVLLGWNEKKDPSPGGGLCTGPYEAWQVVATGAALALIVGIAAWRGHAVEAVAACSVTVTALLGVDAVTVNDPCAGEDGLWVLGAAYLLFGSLIGLSLVAAIVQSVTRGRGSPDDQPSQ